MRYLIAAAVGLVVFMVALLVGLCFMIFPILTVAALLAAVGAAIITIAWDWVTEDRTSPGA